MKNINEKLYDNLSEAVAFEINFTHMIYTYGNVGWDEYETEVCTRCGKTVQYADFLAPKSNCTKEYGILHSLHFGVNETIKNELIEHFDITEDDFRPVRNKKGEIVYYQITPKHTMKPIFSVNRMRALKPCRKCGSVQFREKEYENDKGEFYAYITEEALLDIHDLNVTYEKFNCYMPKYVVSKRVYEYLISKYPRMNFRPFFLKQ